MYANQNDCARPSRFVIIGLFRQIERPMKDGKLASLLSLF